MTATILNTSSCIFITFALIFKQIKIKEIFLNMLFWVHTLEMGPSNMGPKYKLM
jgi:hypothetical protein